MAFSSQDENQQSHNEKEFFLQVNIKPLMDTVTTLEENDDEPESTPLETPWTFWMNLCEWGASKDEYMAALKKIMTVKTVQQFWSVFHHIPHFSTLSVRASYHIMRHERKPVWETDYHSSGGYWRIKCPKEHTFTVWVELLMAAIGEQLEESLLPGDELSGISCSIREHNDLIEIWTTRADLAKQSRLMGKVQKLVPDVRFGAIFYKEFGTLSAFDKGVGHSESKR